MKNLETSITYDRRCKVLVSAVGVLSEPNPCDIAGAASFQGAMFHTADWDHSFDYKGKEVVVIGLYSLLSASNMARELTLKKVTAAAQPKSSLL